MWLQPNFAISPWDDDFDEFVDGIKWKDFPEVGKVELRPKADVFSDYIAAAEARAAEAEARAEAHLAGQMARAEAAKTEAASQLAESQAAQGALVEKMMQGMEA